jgi:hypothetical protein
MNFYKYDNFFVGIKEGPTRAFDLKQFESWVSQYAKHWGGIDFENILPHDEGKPDYYIVPVIFHVHRQEGDFGKPFVKDICKSLKYFESYPEKHIFFQWGDRGETLLHLVENKCNVFKESLHNDTCYMMPYPVDKKQRTPIKDATLDISFQGSLSTWRERKLIKEAFYNFETYHYKDLSMHFYNKDLKINRVAFKQQYYESMQKSKFICCPRGGATNSIRFFESLYYGRIPIFVSDIQNLPLQNVISYEDFVIFVPPEEIMNMHLYVKEFLENNDLEEASQKAMKVYDKYLDIDKMRFFLETQLENPNLKWNKNKVKVAPNLPLL